jgi:serine protease Do
MLHLGRIAFVCFLLAVLAFAVTRYAAAPEHVSQLGNRLIPFVEQAARNAAGELNPNSKVPVFTIDVEGIPPGMTSRGTSFPLGNGLWLTARHVVDVDCGQLILIIAGANVQAHIKYLDRNADLAVLQTGPVAASALPIESASPASDESAYAFGFPKGVLGGTEDQLMGRARMKLGGRLMGTAPVLTWAELQRYPDDLPSLAGISGGPMLDDSGHVIGIIVAASVRRGRNYTVAPEILHKVLEELRLTKQQEAQTPARDVVTPPVSLDQSANALSKNARIAETYCIPP